MRVILVPLFLIVASTFWGQTDLPFTQTPPHIIASAVEAWRASDVHANNSIANESHSSVDMDFAARVERSTISSVQRGIWSEATTWDCNCIPDGDDNVVIEHEVSFVSDAEVGSVYVSEEGTLIDLVEMTLTFHGNFVASPPLPEMTSAHFVANGIAGEQTLNAALSLSKLTVLHRTSLSIQGQVEVTGNVTIDDASIEVAETGKFILSENAFGRATVMRSNGGSLLGPVTRQIILPAIPNRNMPFVEQRIAIGLEGVRVEQLLGDIPTWGFVGADNPEGFANIGYWSANANFNYAMIGSADDLLPVTEGVYLALAPAESYTLDFTGTMPVSDVIVTVPEDAITALFGNSTNANVDLNLIADQLGENKVGFDCWNTKTLQYDHFVDGLNTNGLNGTLQPNTTCQYLPSGTVSLTMPAGGNLPNGSEANASVDLDGKLVFSAENASGYRDEAVIAIRESASVSFLESEDAINTSSLSSACDLYLLDDLGNRSGIAQLGFDQEPMAQFDLVLGSNRPLDGEYVVSIDEFSWMDGCAFIMMADETTPRPIESGELGNVFLTASENHNYHVATVYLVPPVRAEVSSPGCEGIGESAIEVFATGDGPWTVGLSDDNGQDINGDTSIDGATTTFGNLASGTYTYAVLSSGIMSCGSATGVHTVVSPTALDISADITHDCGQGGAIVADVATEQATYVWNHGETGAVLSGLEGGMYTVVATNDFGCTDTLDVTVLSAPHVTVTANNGSCDGGLEADIEVDAMHETALYNVLLLDESGHEAGFAFNAVTPLFFENVATGSYTLELQLLGDYGCALEVQETAVVNPIPMTLNASSEPQCDANHMGSVSTTLEGGTGHVNYLWSNGSQEEELTQTEAGEYTLTVTDEVGCQSSTTVVVAESPSLTVTAVSPGCDGEGVPGFNMESSHDVTWTVDVMNENGEVVQNTTSSSAAFEVSNLPSGTYLLQYNHDIDDGCPAKSVEATLTEASNLAVSVTNTPMQCGEQNSGSIALQVVGGVGDIDVAWDHGAEGMSLQGLTGGQYYAVVSDENGCTKEIRVAVEDSPTVEANFTAPTGGLTDGVNGMTLSFTNTSEGHITGQTWYFGDTDTPSYEFHATHTFDEPGAYDVFLNVWNDKCSHTVRKTVVVSHGETLNNNYDLNASSTSIAQGDLTTIHAPATTESGWVINVGGAASGVKVYVFDLTGRQLCVPARAEGDGKVYIERDEWPALVLLRLVHEPTNSTRTWKMVR